jgi:two-component system KDP operon response regulator KdpE
MRNDEEMGAAAPTAEEPRRILVVDDEREILRALKSGLSTLGYRVSTATAGSEALHMVIADPPDLIILDVMLPGEIDGIEVCRRLREWSSVPILMLSALGQERQKVAALDYGADDYLTKPFGMGELAARVRAALRRYRPDQPAREEALVSFGGLSVDFLRRVVQKHDETIKLTPIEYDVLSFLSRNPDRVVTHRQLLTNVWGAVYAEDTQLLRVHVGHLRRKIEDDPARPALIVTEPGVGYRLRSPDQ